MTVGEVISKYCDTHGISFRQFAEKSELTSGYVSMLVNNRNPKTGKPPIPSVKTYQKIADAMGITFGELLEKTEKDTPSTYHVIPAGAAKEMQATVEASYKGLADAIVEKLRQSDDLGIVADDELLRELEAIRRDPERRKLFKRASHSDIDEVRQANAILDALKETRR